MVNSKKAQKKVKVKVGKLKVSKETVKDLTPGQTKRIQGGATRESLIRCLSDLCTYTAVTI